MVKATQLYFNRDLSWLQFNRRVLALAQKKSFPLLERLRFLTIYHSNLDEFMMKRVGAQKGLEAISKKNQVQHQRRELLKSIFKILKDDQVVIKETFSQLLKELTTHQVHLQTWQQLGAQEQQYLSTYFREKIFPVLTPLSVDQGHPFPFISNLSMNLAVALLHPEKKKQQVLFSRIKIPDFVNSYIGIPDFNLKGQFRFISALEVIEANIQYLFPGMTIKATMPFRITRNAKLSRSFEDAEDLLEEVAESLREQKFAAVVRLEHPVDPDPWLLNFMQEEFPVEPRDCFEVSTHLSFCSLRPVIELPISELHFDLHVPLTPEGFDVENASELFAALKQKDRLVHHPYESFRSSVEAFIALASEDPQVRSIKMTLYRTGDNSPFVAALLRAAEQGKQVVCLVELTARFDEHRNIRWAKKLEEAGVHVVYGIVGIKTHGKIAMVIRQEANGIFVPYVHIGTGNYHAQTANHYTDWGLFTCDPQICSEMMDVFNYLTGQSLKKNYESLLVAPVNMKDHFLALIEREADAAAKGEASGIWAKMNALQDEEVIQALYRASQAGVDIRLYVRGFCCLRPQVAGLSERIRVFSILGRFLEHSRVYCFRQGQQDWAQAHYLLGSADWMHRNLCSRVEVIVPIRDRQLKRRLHQMQVIMDEDRYNVWELDAQGQYHQPKQHHLKAVLSSFDRLRIY